MNHINPTTDASAVSSSSMPGSEFDLVKLDRANKVRLLQLFSRVSIAGLGILILITIFSAILNGSWKSAITIGIGIVVWLIYIFSAWLNRKGYFLVGTWLLIISDLVLIGAVYWTAATMSTIMPLAFMLPILMVLALVGVRAAAFLAGAIFIFNFSLYLIRNNGGTRDIFSLTQSGLLEGIIFVVVMLLLIFPSQSAARQAFGLNQRLQQLLNNLQNRQQTSHEVSHEVLELAVQLNTTAGQQASDSHSQVSTVTQISEAVSELSSTAANINDLSEQVSQAGKLMAQESQQIEETTLRSVSQSEKGLAAVHNSATATQEAARLYQNLLDTMNDLSAKNAKMRLILDLLTNIAAETHLLSLNAAIEAAGASQHGERFAVVAQEVKSLAARSATASKEVVDIISEIESATGSAVESARQGYQQTLAMTKLGEQSGEVITQMAQVAHASQEQAKNIRDTANRVAQLTLIIQTATSQQRSASYQVREALAELRSLAEQNASGSSQVSNSASGLEHLSHRLRLSFNA